MWPLCVPDCSKLQEVAAMQYLSKWLQTEQQNHAMRQLLNNAGIGGLNIAGSPSILNSGGMVYAANPQYISTSVPLPQDLHQVMQQQTFGPYRVPLNMLESHIMMPLDLLTDNRNLYSIMPYCTGGELFEVLEKKSRFSEPEARFWMRQILQVRIDFHRLVPSPFESTKTAIRQYNKID